MTRYTFSNYHFCPNPLPTSMDHEQDLGETLSGFHRGFFVGGGGEHLGDLLKRFNIGGGSSGIPNRNHDL